METWNFTQPTSDGRVNPAIAYPATYWQAAMSPSDWTLFSLLCPNNTLTLRNNPTSTSESNKKPVFEADTVNGINIRMTPMVIPGQPLPVVKKLQVKIEHLRQQDYLAIDLLYQYDLYFILTTSNYLVSDISLPGGISRGRKLCCVIDDKNIDWVALRFGQQVYDISLALRVIPGVT